MHKNLNDVNTLLFIIKLPQFENNHFNCTEQVLWKYADSPCNKNGPKHIDLVLDVKNTLFKKKTSEDPLCQKKITQ